MMIRTSETIEKLAEALAIAQGQMEFAKKEGKSHHGDYAKLENVWTAIKKPFSENGLSVIQIPSVDNTRVTMTTRLLHKSGQWVEGDFSLKIIRDDAHGLGGLVTYLRRYMLEPITGCSEEDADDDGNAAMGKDPKTGKPLEQKEALGGTGFSIQPAENNKKEPPIFYKSNEKQLTWACDIMNKETPPLSTSTQEQILKLLEGKFATGIYALIKEHK